jgi:hypothetical protein
MTQRAPLFDQPTYSSQPSIQDRTFDIKEEVAKPQHNVSLMKYSEEDIHIFLSYLKNNINNHKTTAKNFFKSTGNNKDFHITKSNIVKVQDVLIASEIFGDIERPFFYHTDVLKWILGIDKSFFKKQEDESMNLLHVGVRQYRHFVGDCKNAINVILKCKAKYGVVGYSHDFINLIKDNNHRIVKIIERIVIDRINELLEFCFRTKNSPKLRYSISSLEDIEELVSLDLNTKNDITTHNAFQLSIDSIIRASFDWLFNSKIAVEKALIDSSKEENIIQLLSTNLIKMSNEMFMEYDYFSLDDDTKKLYLNSISENLLFMIPQSKIITGYEDEVFLSRFSDDEYVIIDEFKSPFEVFLSFVLHNTKRLIPTILHIKTNEGFFSIRVGLGLDEELVCKRI